jgi:hypothetical protein
MECKYLQIKFLKSNSEYYTLTYKLIKNSVVDKFIKLLNDTNSQPLVETNYTNICLYKDKSFKLNEKYNELSTNINLFEKENNNGFIFKYKFDLCDISDIKLNRLHTEFEEYLSIFETGELLTNEYNICKRNNYELNEFPDIIKQYLNNINSLIHYLEDIIISIKCDSKNFGYFSTYLYSEPYCSPILLDDDEYDYFDINYEFGDLLLGYGTTGKSLYHVFKDNDLAILENGFVLSPQQYVTQNIISLFKESEKGYDEKFKKWYDDNKIYEKYNIPFNKYNSSGYIKLGELLYSDTEKLIGNLILCDKIIGYEII